MAIQRQDRRGTTVEHNSFTGAVGELTIDTDLDEPRVHDGARAGGFNIPNFSSLQKRLYSYDAAPGGTATAITCSTQVDAIALTAGLEITLKMASAATGASTLTWGSLTTKDIKKYSNGAKVDIEADDWATNQEIKFWYDGTHWVAQLGGGGGFVSSATASNEAYLQIALPSGYDVLKVCGNVSPHSDDEDLRFQLSDDGAVSFETSSYGYVCEATNTSGSVATPYTSVSDNRMNMTPNSAGFRCGDAAGENLSFEMTVQNHNDASNYTHFTGVGILNDTSGNPVSFRFSSHRKVAAVATDLRFFWNTGNITGSVEVTAG